MFTISKEFSFSASHQLAGLRPGHQCGRLHGHNYKVQVILESDKLDGRGFVVDYGDLKLFGEYLDARCDHRHLNEQFSFQPTAENLAKHFYNWIAGCTSWPVAAVRVSETDKTWAEYRPAKPPVVTHIFAQIDLSVILQQIEITEITNVIVTPEPDIYREIKAAPGLRLLKPLDDDKFQRLIG